MLIKKLESSELQKFIVFNKEIYPQRDHIEESISFKLRHPNINSAEGYPFFIAIDNNKIIGQYQRIPCNFFYKGKSLTSYWGMDFIVEKNNRGMAGISLLERVLEKNQFAMGLSDKAFKINKLMKVGHIGNFKKFVYLSSFFKSIQFFIETRSSKTNKKKKINLDFPERISLGNYSFFKTDDYSEFKQQKWFNEDIIEFSRDSEFMKWRFGHYKKTFKTYILEINNQIACYFVVRLVYWKSCPFILLVDYRYKPDYFSVVLRAVKKLLKKNSVFGIITLSSLNETDRSLKKSLFFQYGKIGQIVANFKPDSDKQVILNNTEILVTFADSDADFYYGENKWFE